MAKTQAAARANLKKNSLTAAATSPLLHDEAEPRGTFGSNDSHATAELVKGFGTGKKVNNRARVLGQLSPETVSLSTVSAPRRGQRRDPDRVGRRARRGPQGRRDERRHR